MCTIIYIFIEACQFQHGAKIKYNTCILYVVTEISQGLNSFNFYSGSQCKLPNIFCAPVNLATASNLL